MKTRFRIQYDYIDQMNDHRLSEAAMHEMLRAAKDPDDNKYVMECNDFELRQEWLQDDDCFFVELNGITLYHTAVCVFGLQAEYKCEYDNHKTTLKKGPIHYCSKVSFSFPCGSSAHPEIATVKVSRKESIFKVRPERSGIKGTAVQLSHLLPTQTITI